MTVIRRHNPVLKQRLLQLLQAGDVEGVRQYLTTLSCTDFRTATWLLGDELCVQAELRTDAFWPLFVALTSFNAKTFLGTMLKAAVRLYNKEYVAFDAAALRPFAAKATSIDATKTLQAFLPTLRTADEVQSLHAPAAGRVAHAAPHTCHVLCAFPCVAPVGARHGVVAPNHFHALAQFAQTRLQHGEHHSTLLWSKRYTRGLFAHVAALRTQPP